MKVLPITSLLLVAGLLIAGFTDKKPTSNPDLERNKALVKEFLEAYINVDLNTLDKITHKEYRQFFFDELTGDYDGLIKTLKQKGKAGKVTLHEFIAEADQVLVRYTAEYPPVLFNGVDLFRLKDGKIVEGRFFYKQMN